MIDKSYYKNMPAKNTLNDDNNIHTNDYYTSLEDIPLENMIINSNLSINLSLMPIRLFISTSASHPK